MPRSQKCIGVANTQTGANLFTDFDAKMDTSLLSLTQNHNY